MNIKNIHFETIDSTNDWSKKHLSDCLKEGLTIVTTDFQSAGRGKFSRSWQSQKGQNLLVTYVFFVDRQDIDITPLVQLLAKCVIEVLTTWEIQGAIKWPNDILVKGKKIAGILCETIAHKDSTAIIEGIGLNVNMPHEELKKIDQPATSLLAETGHPHQIKNVLDILTSRFQQAVEAYLL